MDRMAAIGSEFFTGWRMGRRGRQKAQEMTAPLGIRDIPTHFNEILAQPDRSLGDDFHKMGALMGRFTTEVLHTPVRGIGFFAGLAFPTREELLFLP